MAKGVEVGLLADEYEVWMPFKDAGVLIRYLPHALRERLTAESMERAKVGEKTVDGRPVPEVEETYNVNVFLEDYGRAAVKDWKGFTKNGEPLPFSREACDEMMKYWIEFRDFVVQSARSFDAMFAEEERARLGNSSATSGQGSTSRT
jgi:hypothetical protein